MKTLHLNAEHPLQRQRALTLLNSGGVVAVQTETVYGLAADARNPDAVARVFSAKGRPVGHPLIVHIHDRDQLPRWSRDIPDMAWRLAEAFWPGPLTMILPRHPEISPGITGGLDSIALRVPDQPLLRDMMAIMDTGLAAPSANPYQSLSPTRAEHVLASMNGRIDAVLDSGPCPVGLESTIVDLCGESPALVRPGPVTAEQLEAILGCPLDRQTDDRPAPGNEAVHYRPRTQTYRISGAAMADALAWCQERGINLAVISHEKPDTGLEWLPAGHWLWLPDDKPAYAREFYDALHRLDRLRTDMILIQTPPETPEWQDVHNRMAKATEQFSFEQIPDLDGHRKQPA